MERFLGKDFSEEESPDNTQYSKGNCEHNQVGFWCEFKKATENIKDGYSYKKTNQDCGGYPSCDFDEVVERLVCVQVRNVEDDHPNNEYSNEWLGVNRKLLRKFLGPISNK